MDRVSKYFNLLILKQFKIVIISFLLIVCSVPVASNVPFAKAVESKSVYRVLLDGEEIGFVNNVAQAEQALTSAKHKLASELDKFVLMDVKLKFYLENDSKRVNINNLEEDMYTYLTESVDKFKESAYVLKVNDFKVTLSTKDEVKQLLEMVQSKYLDSNMFSVEIVDSGRNIGHPLVANIIKLDKVPVNSRLLTSTPDIDGGKSSEPVDAASTLEATESPIVEAEFAEDIEVFEVFVKTEDIISIDEAFDMITKEKEGNTVYKVQPGDCLSTIAENNRTTVKAILNNNDGLTETSLLKIDQEIIVTTPEPELSVITKEKTLYTKEYSAPVEYVNNANKYKGTKTVLKEGSTGVKEVTALINKKNGVEAGTEVIDETVIVEAKPQVIEIGTKALPAKSPTGKFSRPLSGGRLSSTFGYRWGSFHEGVDYAVPVGTTIKAADGGKVTFAGTRSGYGKLVIVSHGNGVETRYAHLSKILVSEGTKVAQGEKIALSGNTGRSTGPHLHFEIRINGRAQNPLKHLK